MSSILKILQTTCQLVDVTVNARAFGLELVQGERWVYRHTHVEQFRKAFVFLNQRRHKRLGVEPFCVGCNG